MTYPVRIAHPFDDLVSRLTTLASERIDFFQDAVSTALDLTDLDTHLRFCLGDISCLIEGRYGHDRMGEWAAHIKRARSTVYQYASVARYYPLSMRGAWLEEPAISWTHMRIAMSAGLLEDTLEWLDKAASGAWSCDKLAYEMSACVDKSIPPRAIFAGIVTFTRTGQGVSWQGMEDSGIETGVRYKVRIERV